MPPSALSDDIAPRRGPGGTSGRAFAYGSPTLTLLLLLLAYWGTRSPPPATPWRAAFFENVDLTGQPVLVTKHEAIDFNWGRSAPLPTLPGDNFSTRWDTCLRIEEPVRITFRLGSDDGSVLRIDGETIVDYWGVHAYGVRTRGTILNPGTHHLQVEYFESAGDAGVRLTASVPILSASHLVHPGDPFDHVDPCSRIR